MLVEQSRSAAILILGVLGVAPAIGLKLRLPKPLFFYTVLADAFGVAAAASGKPTY